MGNKVLVCRENRRIDKYNKELSFVQLLVNAQGIKWEAPFMTKVGEGITKVKETTLEEKQKADRAMFMSIDAFMKYKGVGVKHG